MQSFKEINGQDNIKNSRTTINDSIKTVMSNNSGTAFPTTNLQVGMKCYRTDLGKTYTLTDVANKTWKEDNHATLADSANKLSGMPVTGINDGQAITNKIPKIDYSGVMEVGKCIDFHSTNNQTTDFTARITANDNGTISVSGGINANLNGNASSASSVPWTGVTGKPSTYPPSGHNHDSAYPATNGSRATGTWGISITGNAANATNAANANKLASESGSNYLTINTTTNSWSVIGSNPGNWLKSIRTNENAPAYSIGSYSAAIAFGGSDTKGIITHAYSSPDVKFAGGSGSTARWKFTIHGGYNNEVYDLNNFPTKTGDGATGTWGINITGSAGSANAVAWGNVSSKPASIVKVASWDGSTLNLTTCT